MTGLSLCSTQFCLTGIGLAVQQSIELGLGHSIRLLHGHIHPYEPRTSLGLVCDHHENKALLPLLNKILELKGSFLV